MAGANIKNSAVATPSAGSTAGKSSSLSVGAAAEIGDGCTVAAVFVAALCLLLHSLPETCKEGSPQHGRASSRVRQWGSGRWASGVTEV